MAVQSPAVENPLTSRLARAALGPAGAVAIAVAAVAIVVGFQPITAPWWLYADADATYTTSGIELMAGEHSFYFDHPGMPLQAVMAATMEVRYLVHKLHDEHETPHAYAAQRLLHLDDSRVFFRGWAILFYVAGAVLAFVATWRLLGGPWWGTAGTALFLAAPGLQAMSVQFRPDGLLAGSVLAVGLLLDRAAERRDAWLYTLAALLLGLALTVKIHAAGLFLPFGAALLWRSPRPGWAPAFARSARDWLSRYWVALGLFAAVWLTFCVTFDRTRVPVSLTHEQRVTCAELGGAYAGYLLLVGIFATPGLRRFARGPLRPLGAVLVTAFAVGVLVPSVLFVNDLPEMLVKMVGGLTGGGVNEGVARFSTPWSELRHEPLLQAIGLLVLAAVAALLGARRRDHRPLLWFLGAALSFAMAVARLGEAHYFAPAFVLSIPPALWLVRELPPRVRPVGALAVVVFALTPVVQHLDTQAATATREEEQSAAIERLTDQLVTQPGTVALSEDYVSPVADVRWFGLVRPYASFQPPYPWRVLSDYVTAVDIAESQHLLPTYFVGALPTQLPHTEKVDLPIGTYTMEPLPATMDERLGVGAAKLLTGPGVDRPFGHPDARYDPATGYYRDPAGAYFDLSGSPVADPPRRRYVARLRAWADAYGDLWDAHGRHVGNDPAYRTAK